ncbi:hypothetical protein [Microvirga sp. CF3016]|uniref:hypothetical protein n=1 Tax=Microvirga sp. CF3016 TaxID=3110181 RepID=UPI002E7A1286|nr:hypothetical protein [Microvirga sp. CF3016]MEE1609828.1 hypothetical protein [Microvirga sp. CF3016]
MASLSPWHVAFSVIALVSQVVSAAACPMPYEKFEAAVPHLDLNSCPSPVAQNNVFCRSSVANDEVHVFVFEDSGDRCLVAVESF